MRHDVILIDDDVMIREHWERRVSRSQQALRVRTFASRQQFQRSRALIPLHSLIFVDQHLQDGESGDMVTRGLFDEGYEALYLCTADPQQRLRQLPWIRGVVGKLPPEWLFDDDITAPVTATERQQWTMQMDDQAMVVYRSRMNEFMAVLYGQDSGAFAGPGLDGFSMPSAVMNAWERAITLGLSDDDIKARVDHAWRINGRG